MHISIVSYAYSPRCFKFGTVFFVEQRVCFSSFFSVIDLRARSTPVVLLNCFLLNKIQHINPLEQITIIKRSYG